LSLIVFYMFDINSKKIDLEIKSFHKVRLQIRRRMSVSTHDYRTLSAGRNAPGRITDGIHEAATHVSGYVLL